MFSLDWRSAMRVCYWSFSEFNLSRLSDQFRYMSEYERLRQTNEVSNDVYDRWKKAWVAAADFKSRDESSSLSPEERDVLSRSVFGAYARYMNEFEAMTRKSSVSHRC